MLRAFLAQSMLHALVAALVVEALLRAWRVADGGWRLRLRLLALAAPLLYLPALFLLAPFRTSPFFVARVALFAGERWNLLSVGGTGVGDLALILAAGLGSALFLRDAVPAAADLVRGGPESPAGPWDPTGPLVADLAARHAASLRVPAPGVRVVRASTPVLLCEGAGRPSLVVSPTTVSRLAPDELDAAVAHEVAHARFRDPSWGFLLLALRGLSFFNPASQWMARSIVDDIERRADQEAVRLTGRADSLARAIETLVDARAPVSPEGDASFERVFWRIRREGVQRRVRRLRDHPVAAAPGYGGLQLALAAGAIAGLLFLVV